MILEHIAAETALEARDRIPLPQFHGLRKSYNALHDKLVARIHPTVTTQKPVSTDATFKTTSAVAPANPSNKSNTVTASAQTSEEIINNRQEKKPKDVSGEDSGDDSSEDEVGVIENSEDARDGQEMRASEESESGNDCSEDEASDDDSGGDDSSNSDASRSEAENQGSLSVKVESARKVSKNRSEENDGDAPDWREVREDEESESGNDSGDNDSGDDDSSDDDSNSDSDASSDEAENQGNLRLEEASARNVTEDRSRFSATFELEIKHQASVNQLESMTAPELLDCVSLSLKDFLRQQQRFSPNLSISSTGLLDNGNLRVVVRAKTCEALQKFIASADLGQRFESPLIGSPAPIYKLMMHAVDARSLDFRNRVEKSAIIRKLEDANRAIGDGFGAKPIINDIFWTKRSLEKTLRLLIVEVLDLMLANQALARGLSWQETRHPCQRADMKGRLLRCGRCQGYGHIGNGCSAPQQCGRCAESHPTATCKSKKTKCASCGGGHRASNKDCPVKVKARESLEFKDVEKSKATKSTAEAKATPSSRVPPSISAGRTQTEASIPSPVSLDDNPSEDEISSKSDLSLPEANPTQATLPDTPTLLKRIEDVEKVAMALKTALETKSSSGTKRRADEAFVDGAEAESSTIAAKRIKQEQPTPKNSMGLYRQPSPFIVHRPQ